MLFQQLGVWTMPTGHILARWSTYRVQCLVILKDLVKAIHGGGSFRKFSEISVWYASALPALGNVAVNVNDQFEGFQSYSPSPVDDRVQQSQGVWAILHLLNCKLKGYGRKRRAAINRFLRTSLAPSMLNAWVLHAEIRLTTWEIKPSKLPDSTSYLNWGRARS